MPSGKNNKFQLNNERYRDVGTADFSKSERVWAAPIKNGVFFLPSFFFCAFCAKEKAGLWNLVYVKVGKKTFFEKTFLPRIKQNHKK